MTAADPSALARSILSESRFRPARVPRPFKPLFDWIAERARPALEPLGRWIDSFVEGVPGPRWFGWVLLAAGTLLVAVAVSLMAVRRRARAIETGMHTLHRTPGEDPRALEGAAEEAERRGDLNAALRLRFRAGLIRLSRASVIEPSGSLTTRQLARSVRSTRFDALAESFEAVAYGGRTATAVDLRHSRSGWDELLREKAG